MRSAFLIYREYVEEEASAVQDMRETGVDGGNDNGVRVEDAVATDDPTTRKDDDPPSNVEDASDASAEVAHDPVSDQLAMGAMSPDQQRAFDVHEPGDVPHEADIDLAADDFIGTSPLAAIVSDNIVVPGAPLSNESEHAPM